MKILSIDAFIEKLHATPLSFDDLDKFGIIKYDVKCFDVAQLKNLDYFMVFKGQKVCQHLKHFRQRNNCRISFTDTQSWHIYYSIRQWTHMPYTIELL